MSTPRLARVDSLIEQEVGRLLRRDFEFPKGSVVTVTRVQAVTDLSLATVWVSVLPIEAAPRAIRIIKAGLPELQHVLNQKLNMRFVPQLRFQIDQTEAKAARIEGLLDELKRSE